MRTQVVEIAQWRARPRECPYCVDGWTTVRLNVSPIPGRPRIRAERFPCDHCGGPPEPPQAA